MLFIVISTHLIELLKQSKATNLDLSNVNFDDNTLKNYAQQIVGKEINIATPRRFYLKRLPVKKYLS